MIVSVDIREPYPKFSDAMSTWNLQVFQAKRNGTHQGKHHGYIEHNM